jgi:hypothetical protein
MCPPVGESRQLRAVQFRLGSLYIIRDEFPPAQGIAKQVLDLVPGVDDPAGSWELILTLCDLISAGGATAYASGASFGNLWRLIESERK